MVLPDVSGSSKLPFASRLTGGGGGGGGGTGRSSRAAVRVNPSNAAVRVTEVTACTGRVGREKLTWAAPGGTVTAAGAGRRSGRLLVSATVVPCGPAGQTRSTSPLTQPPPIRAAGVSVRSAVPPGRTVIGTRFTLPGTPAERVPTAP